MSIDVSHVITVMFALVASLSMHEWAHAYAAYRQGDNTAKDLGRMSINPLVHIDPIGTLVLPLVGAISGLPVIGWAKPVPVNLLNLKSRRLGSVLVASAGPLANLTLVILALGILMTIDGFFPELRDSKGFFYPLIKLLSSMVIINAFLAFFNLLPLPPLDGGAVVSHLLPLKWGQKYDQLIAPLGIWILWALVISGGLWWLAPVSYAYIDGCQKLLELLF